MGSSEKGTGVADCSVGTIVWVRRRNGSWWPGKILGPDELSAAHLMSPRSGTPVKLLGREDASVDWYNLEKSKRVKAFRCGEFDDCIERAESSQGMPPKKREKYARREDAILHALELEKHLLEKKHGKLGSSNGKSSKSSDSAKKELVIPSEGSGYGSANGKHIQPKAHSKKVDLSFEDKSMDHELNAQKIKEGKQLAGDEDNSEVIPRTRGLQDFGLKITPAKRKISSSVALNGSRKPESGNNAHALSGTGVGVENTAHASNRSSLDKKRKLNEVLIDESLVRRRDRRRPLVQVMQSSAKLGVHPLQHDSDAVSAHTSGEKQAGVTHGAKRSSCVYLPGESSDCSDEKQIPNQMVMPRSDFEVSNCPQPAALAKEHTSESTENTETDSSGTDSLDSDVDEDMVELSDAAVVAELEPKSPRISGTQMQHGSRSSEEPDDLALSGGKSHFCPPEPVLASMGASEWKLKGKRNNRGFTKRSNDVIDRRVSRGSMYGNLEEPESIGCDEPDLIGKNFRTRKHAFDNRGYLSTSKFTPKGFDDITHGVIDWEDLAWNDQPILKGYWEDSSNYFDPVFVGGHGFGGRMNSMLIDVDLKVQSSYQREHVPMISLMSKLNGQAIVGYPVQIEALENGSFDILLSAADGICPETSDNDTALAPVWRTARRTANFRIPRSHPSATLDGEETAEHGQYVDQDKKTLFKKSNVGSFGHKPSTTRKSLSHASRAPLDRKFSRKPPKKVSLSSSQKIKTLSSISSEHKLGNDSKHGNNSYQVDGLIKGESGPTAVACIPVKLVFSRLYEELVGRHQ